MQECIESILESRTPDVEIVVVDNGSADGTPRKLREAFADRVCIVETGSNIGPSAARNVGVAHCGGDLIGFLDNDTKVHPNWAQAAAQVFDRDPTVGAIQCKLLVESERNRIDYMGEFLGQNGFLVQYAPSNAFDDGSYDRPIEILAAKSAGMFIRKKIFGDIGGFDPDYFIYMEETDLGWRVWLHGSRVLLAPESVVYHHFGGSAVSLGRQRVNFNAKYHGCKNYVLTLIKNLEAWSLCKILPVHVASWMGLAAFSLVRGQWRSCIWILRGLGWNILNMPANWRKRWTIQRSRCTNDKTLLPIIMRRKPWRYFLNKARCVQTIGHAEGFVPGASSGKKQRMKSNHTKD